MTIPIEYPCPICGGATSFDVDCPGWHAPSGRVMVCQGCGNADRYDCAACGWWYRDPVGIRSDVPRMGIRPTWLDVRRVEIRPVDGDW